MNNVKSEEFNSQAINPEYDQSNLFEWQFKTAKNIHKNLVFKI